AAVDKERRERESEREPERAEGEPEDQAARPELREALPVAGDLPDQDAVERQRAQDQEERHERDREVEVAELARPEAPRDVDDQGEARELPGDLCHEHRRRVDDVPADAADLRHACGSAGSDSPATIAAGASTVR